PSLRRCFDTGNGSYYGVERFLRYKTDNRFFQHKLQQGFYIFNNFMHRDYYKKNKAENTFPDFDDNDICMSWDCG
ncbi:MAG: hypothetical protein K2N77_07130, partial [Lachnospiraceae bacterium]|nr:hypothetical protein [Lachnospiraceae bacterium]